MLDPTHPLMAAEPAPLVSARTISTIQARPILSYGRVVWPTKSYNPLLAWRGSRLSALADIAVLIVGLGIWTLIAELLAQAIAKPAPGEPLSPESNLLVTLISGCGWVVVVAGILWVRRQSFSSVGLHRSNFPLTLLWGLACVPATYGAHFLAIGMIFALWPEAWAQLAQNAENLGEKLPELPAVAYLAVMLAVAFYEELVFRGFVMTRLRRLTGTWWIAVPVSSALFALPHLGMQEPAALLPLFCIACVFGVFTAWRRSLIPAIIGHWTFNSMNIITLQYLQKLQPPLQ